MHNLPLADTKNPTAAIPWHHQFWPWFIMALPAAAVIAGLTTVYIAFKTQDSVVRDDWYKEGKSININFSRDDTARTMGLSAQVRIDALTGEINAQLQGKSLLLPPQLQLFISHPTQALADQTLILRLGPDQRYYGQLNTALKSRYYLELGTAQWRLTTEQIFPVHEFRLSASAISMRTLPTGH